MTAAWVVLITGAVVALYILAGYPLLLALAPFKAAPAVRKDLSHQATVSLIMAVYNGAAHIQAKLETILALDYPKQLVQIIVVSDGSTDETEAMVREYSGRGVELLAAPHGGKAAALNLALERASGEVLFFTDVRQSLEPAALRHLVANFADPTVGAVTGEMHLRKAEAGEQANMDLYWRYEIWARQRQTSIDSIFNTTGCIYAIRRKLAAPLHPDTLSDDAALPLTAFFKGYRVIFDAEAIAVDDPAVAGTEFRRRLRNLAGLWQTFARFPQLFSSANRMRFHFLSHKFSRLVLPWAIVLVIVGTLLLPASTVRWRLIGAEGIFFVLAAADGFFPKGFALRRLSSPMRTFVTMNVASMAGLAVFFVEPTRLWLPTRVKRSG
ncbi:MAG: glycosyltransferase family 2 protein [Bryobacteraceae bacterium]|jgi:cellulose synthase/poly-beta-1,6-N-acetylglucosamine synthase-like glycosyltransferase